ncbi:hypothetical protein GCM10027578_43810 [Spirosoma luteolum]
MYRLLLTQTARYGWLLLSLVMLLACEAPEDKRPDDVIPEDRMANILTEIHLIEARVNRFALPSGDSSRALYKHLEGQLFRRMKVDTATYSRSYIFYSSHPKEMQRIYESVVDQLKKKTGQADTLRQS